MMGYEQIKNWILGMGPSVTVLSPENLVEDIRKDINKMMKVYESKK